MRDAVHVQKYRVNSTQLDPDMVIQRAAARAIDARKAASAASVINDRGSRGRGRGRGSGQYTEQLSHKSSVEVEERGKFKTKVN